MNDVRLPADPQAALYRVSDLVARIAPGTACYIRSGEDAVTCASTRGHVVCIPLTGTIADVERAGFTLKSLRRVFVSSAPNLPADAN